MNFPPSADHYGGIGWGFRPQIVSMDWVKNGGMIVDAGSKRRELILASIETSAVKLLHDDRKEDEELPLGAIEAAVREGEIAVGEMVQAWADQLRANIRPWGVAPQADRGTTPEPHAGVE